MGRWEGRRGEEWGGGKGGMRRWEGRSGEVGRAERGGGRGGVGRWEGRDEEGQRLICATCVRPCVTQD